MKPKSIRPFIGTAGWSIPSSMKHHFAQTEASHLERYAQVFNAVEINSCFYQDHKADTYKRWAESTPDDFSFSAKLSRYFTQDSRLADHGEKLKNTLSSLLQLQTKLKVLLVQLPPSLEFKKEIAYPFVTELRNLFSETILWEPRHVSWATDEAIDLLARVQISKVIADPEPCPLTIQNRAKVDQVRYFRLHGSPEIYKSNYSEKFISSLTNRVQLSLQKNIPTWVIFDNTTYGYAIENAINLMRKINSQLQKFQESPHA